MSVAPFVDAPQNIFHSSLPTTLSFSFFLHVFVLLVLQSTNHIKNKDCYNIIMSSLRAGIEVNSHMNVCLIKAVSLSHECLDWDVLQIRTWSWDPLQVTRYDFKPAGCFLSAWCLWAIWPTRPEKMGQIFPKKKKKGSNEMLQDWHDILWSILIFAACI